MCRSGYQPVVINPDILVTEVWFVLLCSFLPNFFFFACLLVCWICKKKKFVVLLNSYFVLFSFSSVCFYLFSLFWRDRPGHRGSQSLRVWWAVTFWRRFYRTLYTSSAWRPSESGGERGGWSGRRRSASSAGNWRVSHPCASGCVPGGATDGRRPCRTACICTVECASECASWGRPDWRRLCRSVYSWRIFWPAAGRSGALGAWSARSRSSRIYGNRGTGSAVWWRSSSRCSSWLWWRWWPPNRATGIRRNRRRRTRGLRCRCRQTFYRQ